ncbi:MAG: S8 family serine peptidase [Planctomycetota bacterium]|nr:S8 family serine peptidase [Planctomycetota bacterium]
MKLRTKGRWTSEVRGECLESRCLLTAHGLTTSETWRQPTQSTAEVFTESQNVQQTQVRRWQQRDRVGGRDVSDSFQLNLTASSRIQLDVSGQWVPIQVTVTDLAGRTFGRAMAFDTPGAVLAGELAAGSYRITVSSWSNFSTPYILTLDVADGNPVNLPTLPATPPTSQPNPPQATPPATSPKAPTTSAPQVFPDVANYGGTNEWNLNSINTPESWAQGYSGQGVVVAVVDSGVDWNHPDLQGAIWTNPGEIAGDGIDNDRNGYVDDTRGWDFANGDNNPMDENGHGTHVAGTIVAARNDIGATGVAYQADVMPVRVLGANGSGTDFAVAQGIRYSVDNGADIINLSLGSASYSSYLTDALSYAASKNVLVVAAAGNEAATKPSYPARFSNQWTNIISVGAYDRTSVSAPFSNAVGNVGAVQVSVPGVDIFSTLPKGRYGRLSGTSMAAPHVAGLAALALSANPSFSAAELRTLLTKGADRTVAETRGVGNGVNAATSVAQANRVPKTSSSQKSTSNTIASHVNSTASGQTLGSFQFIVAAANQYNTPFPFRNSVAPWNSATPAALTKAIDAVHAETMLWL